jgi:hypothetical protein
MDKTITLSKRELTFLQYQLNVNKQHFLKELEERLSRKDEHEIERCVKTISMIIDLQEKLL